MRPSLRAEAGKEDQRSALARILLATDGAASSDGALRLGSLLRGEGSDVRALAVLTPLAPYAATVADSSVIVPVEPAAGDRLAAVREKVLAQMERVLGEELPLDVCMDWPAAAIARQAAAWKADLILMGLGRHRPVDRLLGAETTNRVLRESSAPVLAVPEDAALLPKVIVAGMDFSKSSEMAIETAIALSGGTAELHLVHVGPAFHPLPHSEGAGWMEIYATGVEQRLGELAEAIRAERPDLVIRSARLAGSPAEQLLEYAKEHRADLVVAGAQRHSRADRLFYGTVSAQLVRGARCAVLVTPVLGPPAVRRAEKQIDREGRAPLSGPERGARRLAVTRESQDTQ